LLSRRYRPSQAKVRSTTDRRHHGEGRHDRWSGAGREPAPPPAAIVALHDLERNAAALVGPIQERAAVAAIGPAVPGEPAAVQPPEQLQGAVAVADVGGGHPDLADQAAGVDQQVALAAVDPLGAVVAVAPPVEWS